MIYAKSEKDLDKMRAVGELIAGVRETLRGMVEPGISTMELNNAAEKMIRGPFTRGAAVVCIIGETFSPLVAVPLLYPAEARPHSVDPPRK